MRYQPRPVRVTYKLTPAARAEIRAAGIPIADFVRFWAPFSLVWGGDSCGCIDDRCIDFHHDANQDCLCLAECIKEAKRVMAA